MKSIRFGSHLVNHWTPRRIDKHRVLLQQTQSHSEPNQAFEHRGGASDLHHVESLGVHEVAGVLVKVAMQAHDIRGLQHILDRGEARHSYRPLALGFEELA